MCIHFNLHPIRHWLRPLIMNDCSWRTYLYEMPFLPFIPYFFFINDLMFLLVRWRHGLLYVHPHNKWSFFNNGILTHTLSSNFDLISISVALSTFFFTYNTSVDTEMCCPKGKCGCQYFILLTLKKKNSWTQGSWIFFNKKLILD